VDPNAALPFLQGGVADLLPVCIVEICFSLWRSGPGNKGSYKQQRTREKPNHDLHIRLSFRWQFTEAESVPVSAHIYVDGTNTLEFTAKPAPMEGSSLAGGG
jgi:hypothetical protein